MRFVVDAETGAVAQEITYDEFGRVLSDSNPGFQPFYFVGGLYDLDTKLTRFGARDYDGEIGRWTTKDPIGFDGGLNHYAYVENDPINLLDISGLGPIEKIIAQKLAEYLSGKLIDYGSNHAPRGLPRGVMRTAGGAMMLESGIFTTSMTAGYSMRLGAQHLAGTAIAGDAAILSGVGLPVFAAAGIIATMDGLEAISVGLIEQVEAMEDMGFNSQWNAGIKYGAIEVRDTTRATRNFLDNAPDVWFFRKVGRWTGLQGSLDPCF